MNTVEAADYLELSPRTLINYRSKGNSGGPPFTRSTKGKRAVVYKLSDIKRWSATRGTRCPTCGKLR